MERLKPNMKVLILSLERWGTNKEEGKELQKMTGEVPPWRDSFPNNPINLSLFKTRGKHKKTGHFFYVLTILYSGLDKLHHVLLLYPL
jgi:hypothetical protein